MSEFRLKKSIRRCSIQVQLRNIEVEVSNVEVQVQTIIPLGPSS